MNHSTSHRIVVVTARGHYAFRTSGRLIEGADLRTSARTADAARLACFTLAGEADAEIVCGLRWAAAMIFYLLRRRAPERPTNPAGLPPRDAALMLRYGRPTPRQNWQAAYREWAATLST